MSEAVVSSAWTANAAAQAALRASAVAWFVPAMVGQWIFAYHVAETYIGPAFAGHLAAWNERLFVGLIAGDLAGNIALAAHLFIALIVTVGGPLQLSRRSAPTLRRFTGGMGELTFAPASSPAWLGFTWSGRATRSGQTSSRSQSP